MKCGIDLIKIDRLKELINDERFMNKVFTENELYFFNSIDNNLSSIAGIYASKEAFIKATKKGMIIPFNDIEVLHDEYHAPYIVLHNKLKEEYGNCNIDLSISHDGEYATAIVVLD